QRRGAELAELPGGEALHSVEDGGPDVAPDGGGGAGAEVDGADVADELDERDAQHQCAEAQDVTRVTVDDTVVDDVRVERGQVETRAGLQQLQQDQEGDGFP